MIFNYILHFLKRLTCRSYKSYQAKIIYRSFYDDNARIGTVIVTYNRLEKICHLLQKINLAICYLLSLHFLHGN